MKEKNKIKRWFDEHKNEIKAEAVRVGWYAFGFCVGYFLCDKISEYSHGSGLRTLHEDGIIKFFDPSSGLEVDVEKAVEIAKEIHK